ncbi:MAG: LysE family translocator [Microbacteriaceae bacterium]
MNETAAIAAIALAMTMGIVSPGPSVLMVASTSVSKGRAAGLWAALGMGCGGLFFSLSALVGLYTILATVPWLFVALKVAGGAYLVYIGVRMWRGSRKPMPFSVTEGSDRAPLWQAVMTQISNPKTAIVYGGVFSAFMPQHPTVMFYLVIPPILFSLEVIWYAVVSLVFSSAGPRAAYARAKTAIDRVASLVMAGLGVRLVFSAWE